MTLYCGSISKYKRGTCQHRLLDPRVNPPPLVVVSDQLAASSRVDKQGACNAEEVFSSATGFFEGPEHFLCGFCVFGMTCISLLYSKLRLSESGYIAEAANVCVCRTQQLWRLVSCCAHLQQTGSRCCYLNDESMYFFLLSSDSLARLFTDTTSSSTASGLCLCT